MQSIENVTLTGPLCYLATRYRHFCQQHLSLRDFADSLPCWVPQAAVSKACGFSTSMLAVIAPYYKHSHIWAPEFSNVHISLEWTEPILHIDGQQYRSSEHYFQLMKFKHALSDEDFAELAAEMWALADPQSAYALGRSRRLSAEQLNEWESRHRDAVMRRAIYAKFTQNPELRELLLSTGTHDLVQIKPGDGYWGTDSDGTGKNMLGVMLQELREQLRTHDDAAGPAK
eukprot:TRINITY_DN14133_c0_g1_i1.p1 TRINITY_DN14133_c0_g1~~TRINITY_DN14133_c0_g1_i1.p1  ORF type:complete len:229 (+),score=41.51 TRINITY_DN14133_c0_g1_i1:43-729(+)